MKGIKVKNLCSLKDRLERMKRQGVNRATVASIHTWDEALDPEIYKEHLKPSDKKQAIQLKAGQRSKQMFHRRRHTGYREHILKKMFDVTGH